MTFTGIFVPGLNTAELAREPCVPGRDVLHDAGTEGGRRGDEIPALLLRRHSAVAAERCRSTRRCSWPRRPMRDGALQLRPDRRFPRRALAATFRFGSRISIRACRGLRALAAIPFEALTAYRRGRARASWRSPTRRTTPCRRRSAKRLRASSRTARRSRWDLGKIPTAALRALKGRRNLKIHSGLIPEAVVDLEDAGALAPGVSVTGGVAIGSRRLYDRVGGAAYRFHPVSYTHSPRVLAEIDNFVTLNSAMEVDLFGQAYAEFGPSGFMSGRRRRVGFCARRPRGGRRAHRRARGLREPGRCQPHRRSRRRPRTGFAEPHGYGRRRHRTRRRRPSRARTTTSARAR